jgi:hypothetical protein
VRLRLLAEDVHFVLVQAFVTATTRHRYVKRAPEVIGQFSFEFVSQ